MKNNIKRRVFLKETVLAGMAGMIATGSAACALPSGEQQQVNGSNVPERILLNLTESPSGSIAATWRTKNEIEQYVQWCVACDSPIDSKGNKEKKADSSSIVYNDENTVTNHSVIIDGLEPDTQYLYRVGDKDTWSEWFEFKTAGAKDQPFSFVYLGDVQTEIKSQCSRVLRKAYATAPDAGFFLYAGDLINHDCNDLEWGEWFDAGSFIHSSVPSIMTPGNHEYEDGVLDDHWKPQFTLPQNGPATELCRETGFFVDYQDLRVISLDAEIMDESELAANESKKWLEKVLRDNKSKWTILTLHFPFYSTKDNRDNPELRDNFQPIIEKYNVDMVLTGHDHAYGRGMENIKSMTNEGEISGPMYVVSVCGPKQYSLSDKGWMTRKAGNTQLFQVISIDGKKLNFKAYTATGKLYDEFDLVKREGKNNKLIDKAPNTPERLFRG